MITTIHLQNFQAHRDTRLPMAKGLTILRGSTNAGKSAIIRAFRWILQDDGDWKTLLRKGETQMAVTLIFENGISVTRTRSASINRYEVKGGNGEVLDQYNDFGKGVPERVLQYMGFTKVVLDGKALNLNLASQQEPWFLLGDSPPSVYRKLCALSHTEEIEQAATACGTEKARKHREAGELQEQIGTLKVAMSDLHWVDRAAEQYAKAVEVEQVTATLQTRLEHIDFFVRWYAGYTGQIAKLQAQHSKLQEINVDAADSLITQLAAASDKLNNILHYITLQQRLDQTISNITAAQQEIAVSLMRLEPQLAAVATCPLCGQRIEAHGAAHGH